MCKMIVVATGCLMLAGCAMTEAYLLQRDGAVRVEPHPSLPDHLRISWRTLADPPSFVAATTWSATDDGRRALLPNLVPEPCAARPLVEEERVALQTVGSARHILLVTRLRCPEARRG